MLKIYAIPLGTLMLTAANHANYKDARSSRPLFRAASGNMFLLSGRASPTGVTLTVEEIQCVVAPKPAIFILLPIQDYTTLHYSSPNCSFHSCNRSRLTPLPPHTSMTMGPCCWLSGDPSNSSLRNRSEYTTASDAPQAGSTRMR